MISATYNKITGAATYCDEGVEITKAEFDRRVPKRGITPGHAPRGHHQACWPMMSDALGVNPDQIASARENLKQQGVPTEFDPRTGQAILTSRGHRKKLAQAIGAVDRSPKASWGDP